MSPRLAVPAHIMRPPYVDTGENPFYDEIQVHDAQARRRCSQGVHLGVQVWHYADKQGRKSKSNE